MISTSTVTSTPAVPIRLIAALVGTLFVGCTEPSTSSVPAGEVVVARLDGQPILASEVRMHLRVAPPRVGTAPAVDPRQQALDAAIRVRLFAREGRRRGYTADGSPATVQAALVRGVVAAETEGDAFQAAAISDQEARRFYEANAIRFNHPTTVRVSAIVLDDPDLAEKVMHQAAAADAAELARLVREHSVDEPSRERDGDLGVIDDRTDTDPASGIDPNPAALAMLLKRVGQVGLVGGTDGRYYVLRATEVDLTIQPWDLDPMRVKNVMVYERRNRALDALEQRLREQSRSVVVGEALAALALPTP